MTDQNAPPPTTPTTLCRNCGRSIRKEKLSLSTQWIHNWSFLTTCGLGRSTEAEPQ